MDFRKINKTRTNLLQNIPNLNKYGNMVVINNSYKRCRCELLTLVEIRMLPSAKYTNCSYSRLYCSFWPSSSQSWLVHLPSPIEVMDTHAHLLGCLEIPDICNLVCVCWQYTDFPRSWICTKKQNWIAVKIFWNILLFSILNMFSNCNHV